MLQFAGTGTQTDRFGEFVVLHGPSEPILADKSLSGQQPQYRRLAPSLKVWLSCCAKDPDLWIATPAPQSGAQAFCLNLWFGVIDSEPPVESTGLAGLRAHCQIPRLEHRTAPSFAISRRRGLASPIPWQRLIVEHVHISFHGPHCKSNPDGHVPAYTLSAIRNGEILVPLRHKLDCRRSKPLKTSTGESNRAE